MEEKSNQVQQQVADENMKVDKKIKRPIPIRDINCLKDLRANTKAIEELTAKVWELDNTLKLIYHLQGACVG